MTRQEAGRTSVGTAEKGAFLFEHAVEALLAV